MLTIRIYCDKIKISKTDNMVKCQKYVQHSELKVKNTAHTKYLAGQPNFKIVESEERQSPRFVSEPAESRMRLACRASS
jgi:hypothetical protein